MRNKRNKKKPGVINVGATSSLQDAPFYRLIYPGNAEMKDLCAPIHLSPLSSVFLLSCACQHQGAGNHTSVARLACSSHPHVQSGLLYWDDAWRLRQAWRCCTGPSWRAREAACRCTRWAAAQACARPWPAALTRGISSSRCAPLPAAACTNSCGQTYMPCTQLLVHACLSAKAQKAAHGI